MAHRLSTALGNAVILSNRVPWPVFLTVFVIALAAIPALPSLLAAAPARAQDAPTGADTFARNCAGCHGAHADGGQGPSLLVGLPACDGRDPSLNKQACCLTYPSVFGAW
jgi:mono/diheme cytochrome c family protein